MVVLGGIEYMGSEGPFSKSSAKEKIWNAIFGLMLALGIVLLLNTINPNLTNLNLDLGTSPSSGTLGGGGGTTTPSVKNDDLERILQSENQNRASLQSGNVYVNKNPCTAVGQTNCTNVGGLPASVLSGLKRIAETCNTRIWVSGGTEWWLHTTHGPDIPIVDISKTRDSSEASGKLYACLKQRFGITETAIPLGRNFVDPILNASFYNEDANHFHVTFRSN